MCCGWRGGGGGVRVCCVEEGEGGVDYGGAEEEEAADGGDGVGGEVVRVGREDQGWARGEDGGGRWHWLWMCLSWWMLVGGLVLRFVEMGL